MPQSVNDAVAAVAALAVTDDAASDGQNTPMPPPPPPSPSPPPVASTSASNSDAAPTMHFRGAFAAQARPAHRSRGAVRRRSYPVDNRRGVANGRVGRHRGNRTGPRGRHSSLECLQFVSRQILKDLLPNQGLGEDSDTNSEISSYSAVVAGSRRASNAGSDYSSSGVSSFSYTSGPIAMPVRELAVVAAPDSGPDPDPAPSVITPLPDPDPDPAPGPSRGSDPDPDPEPEPIPETSSESASELVSVPTSDDEDREVELHLRHGYGSQLLGTQLPDYDQSDQNVCLQCRRFKVWYQGRNILDLANNLTTPWPMRPVVLPESNQSFYLENRTLYQRLGPFGNEEPLPPVVCGDCGFTAVPYY